MKVLRPAVLVAAALLAGCGQVAAPATNQQSSPATALVSATAAPATSPAPVPSTSTGVLSPASQAPGTPAPSAAPQQPSPVTSAATSASAAAIPSVAPSIAPSAAPGPKLPPNPATKRIGPLTFISQTLNNCGPASVAEVLEYWGIHRTQGQVAQVLRPSLPDYGMSLFGVPFYAESVGMRTAAGINGSQALIKTFVANGIPVIVADLVSRNEAIRHFRPIDGYDDAAGYFIGSDPYLGPNHKIAYADFDDLWKISTFRWVVLFPPDKQSLVDDILAQDWHRSESLQSGIAVATQRAAQQPKLPWSWMELADAQIETGDLTNAAQSIKTAANLGLPFEAHWLQLKLDRSAALTPSPKP